MLDVIIEIITTLFRLVFEILFTWTGEIVLYAVTFGRHKPQWDLYTNQSPARFAIFSEISLWIGMAFWIAVIALLYKVLAKG